MYTHTQRGPWHYVMFALAVFCVASTVTIDDDGARWVLMPVAVLFAVLGLCLAHLRVEDEGEWLDVRFGPISLIGKRIPYTEIVGVNETESRFIDGWGIHWIPGRGWTYNIWGFSCVELELEGGRLLRVGSDDARNLAAFVRARIAT